MLVSLGVTRERSRLGSGVEVIEIAISHEINRTGMQVWLYLVRRFLELDLVGYAQMLSLLCEGLS